MIILFGILIAGIGGYLLYNRKLTLAKNLDVKYLETSTISEIIDRYQHISDQLGAGNYSEMVEVKGRSESATPLIADFSKQSCVYFKAQITRKYEVQEEKRDKDGNLTRNWVTKTDVLSTNERSSEFFINDGTGSIAVNSENSEKHPIKSYDKFEPGQSPGQVFTSFSLGGLSMNLSGFEDTSTSRTIGFIYSEQMIPLNSNLYVMGESNDRVNGLAISRPADPKNHFIVSTKSEEQMVGDMENSAKWGLIGGVVLIVIGLGLLIVGLF